MYSPNLVSVFIPTCNGRADLERLLPVLFDQEATFPLEVVCIDSSSTDGTWELLGDYPIRRERIARTEFNHGATRNRGIAMSKGDIIVLLTQDALPQSRDWLSTIVSNYGDPMVAGVYCRQVPRPEGTLLPKVDAKLMPAGGDARVENRLSDHPHYAALSADQRRTLCNFDDICSSLRRTVWERIPFNALPFAEDLDWGKRVFEAGYTLVFEPRVQVMHSHDRSFGYEFKRSFVTFKVLDDMFARGDDKFSLITAMRAIFLAPTSLQGVYPEFREASWGQRMRSYYIVAARALGHAVFNLWYRRYRKTHWGDRLSLLLHRNV